MLDSATLPVTTPCGAEVAAPIRRVNKRALMIGFGLAAVVMFAAEVLRIFVGSNFHDVVPDRCFRSAQPTPAFLESAQRYHGIRSIVNLRDENNDETWYNLEKAAAERLGIQLINAGLCSTEQPPDHDFARLVKAIKNAPEPILIHCANGNDRTGLASAMYLLLRTDASPAQARGHLSLRYGHFSWTRASCLRRILDSYESWLQETGQKHHPDQFYYWGTNLFRQEPLR